MANRSIDFTNWYLSSAAVSNLMLGFVVGHGDVWVCLANGDAIWGSLLCWAHLISLGRASLTECHLVCEHCWFTPAASVCHDVFLEAGEIRSVAC